ncbi:hypothetical protein JKP88DRAFT_318558 [Tribonema minus]|uniref:Uncharacterized protein n=1 Tax=Tribonema minus TaxID=303371 RepID=A0A835YXM3_9STRA|nr:hypothetical protein JKP88DRAFT_318558 [Tribonema minus]
MNCSIRNGKLVHSARFKPEAALVQAKTNWQAGIDPPSYQTTYSLSVAVLSPADYRPMPRLDKNRSHKEAIQGEYQVPAEEFYTTDYKAGYAGGGVPSTGFKRQRPLPGYDRLTASRTNYSLGTQPATSSTAAAEQFADPRTRTPVQQPCIGPADACLGSSYHIITGESWDAREQRLRCMGPRHTLNQEERCKLHPTDSWGGDLYGTHVDIVTGKRVANPIRPPAPTVETLLRPDALGLRTRPW